MNLRIARKWSVVGYHASEMHRWGCVCLPCRAWRRWQKFIRRRDSRKV